MLEATVKRTPSWSGHVHSSEEQNRLRTRSLMKEVETNHTSRGGLWSEELSNRIPMDTTREG